MVVAEIKFESNTYYIYVKSIKDNNRECKKNIALEFENKKLETKKEIIFCNRTVKISNINLLDGENILVHGELENGGDILTIINVNNGNIIDTIWGRDMSVSKDMKMMAYKFRYPPHGLPLYYSDVLLVYDFSRTPLENSMNKSSITDPEQRGFILYPDENRTNKKYYTIAQSENEQHNITSPLVWNKNSIFFLDSLGGKTYLVIIDISDGLSNPKATIRELDKKLFYKEQYLKKIDKEYEKANLVAEELQLTKDKNFVEIKPFAHGPFNNKKLKIRIRGN
jgi:hypothetical protein